MSKEKGKPVLKDGTGRNEKGWIKKGYALNPNGRPPKRKIEDYITEKDVIAIVEKAREEALKGKPDLLKELLGYMFGKPKQGVELSGEDGKPIPILSLENVLPNNSDKKNSENEKEDQSSTGRNECEQDNINIDLPDSNGTTG